MRGPAVQAERGGADTRVLVAVHPGAVVPGAQLHVHLVFIRHIVDEAGVQGISGEKRTAVEKGSHFRFTLLAGVGDSWTTCS